MNIDRPGRKIVCQRFALRLGHKHHAALDEYQALDQSGLVRKRQLLIESVLVGPKADDMDERDSEHRYQNKARNQRIEQSDHARVTAGTNI